MAHDDSKPSTKVCEKCKFHYADYACGEKDCPQTPPEGYLTGRAINKEETNETNQ